MGKSVGQRGEEGASRSQCHHAVRRASNDAYNSKSSCNFQRGSVVLALVMGHWNKVPLSWYLQIHHLPSYFESKKNKRQRTPRFENRMRRLRNKMQKCKIMCWLAWDGQLYCLRLINTIVFRLTIGAKQMSIEKKWEGGSDHGERWWKKE